MVSPRSPRLRRRQAVRQIVILNDEAHHCCIDKPLAPEAAADGVEAADADDKARNEDARVWFKGIRAIQETVGVKAV